MSGFAGAPVGICKRCKKRRASYGRYCEPCFFEVLKEMDDDMSEPDRVHEDDVPIIELSDGD